MPHVYEPMKDGDIGDYVVRNLSLSSSLFFQGHDQFKSLVSAGMIVPDYSLFRLEREIYRSSLTPKIDEADWKWRVVFSKTFTGCAPSVQLRSRHGDSQCDVEKVLGIEEVFEVARLNSDMVLRS